ncbi:hypothetical protein Halhy_1282 [Haliscomenobacter hydrossis DSM 1100]|uniref:Uncharacterized protein n=1 Tax=Haliscomenobacter hydrossis (strain ATCC 27775 / DSM 1100 / LMG 10767 / O) TaxID=760192 RepID=F4KV11_HALH1|nr:hypothetical protein Halhy_1282 [Haliscomenobacter hydrossis DSM 1100]
MHLYLPTDNKSQRLRGTEPNYKNRKISKVNSFPTFK